MYSCQIYLVYDSESNKNAKEPRIENAKFRVFLFHLKSLHTLLLEQCADIDFIDGKRHPWSAHAHARGHAHRADQGHRCLHL